MRKTWEAFKNLQVCLTSETNFAGQRLQQQKHWTQANGVKGRNDCIGEYELRLLTRFEKLWLRSSSSNRYESSVVYTTVTRAAAAATGAGHLRLYSKQPLTATATTTKKRKMVVSEYLIQYCQLPNITKV